MSQPETKILKKIEVEKLYCKLVKDYIDNRGYSKEQANAIVQTIIRRELARRGMWI